jgi:predicted dehydrogenase
MRIGIMGCGLVGRKRAAAARNHRVVVACDVSLEAARALAHASPGCLATTSVEDVWRADLDTVIVATPHDALAPLALAAIRAGKHVLVEKPAARTRAELAPVLAAAAARAVKVHVGYNHRFHPAALRARALVDAGAIGPLLFVRGRYGHGGRPGYGEEWRSRPEISGGGELLDQGTHLLDLARWFLGDLQLAYASIPRWFWPGAVEDNCFLALRGRPDTMAWLHAGWTEWKNLFSLELTGRDGKLQLDGLGGSYGTERLTHFRMLPALGPPETTIWEYPAGDRSFELELEAFAGARPGDTRSLEDALAVLALTDAAYASKEPRP